MQKTKGYTELEEILRRTPKNGSTPFLRNAVKATSDQC